MYTAAVENVVGNFLTRATCLAQANLTADAQALELRWDGMHPICCTQGNDYIKSKSFGLS